MDISNQRNAIYCITETWLADCVQDRELYVEGFNIFRGDRPSQIKTKGGGILIATPALYNVVEYCPFYCSVSFEAISLRLCFATSVIFLIVLYRPPNAVSEKVFVKEFKEYYYNNKFEKKSVIILGDFNFPTIDLEEFTYEKL